METHFELLEYSVSYNTHQCNTITKIAKCQYFVILLKILFNSKKQDIINKTAVSFLSLIIKSFPSPLVATTIINLVFIYLSTQFTYVYIYNNSCV